MKTLFDHGVLRITPLTPVHIGSGDRYQPIDYAIHNNRFIVKDVLGFIDAQRDNPQYALDAIENGLIPDDGYVRFELPFHGAVQKGTDGGPRSDRGAPRSHRDKADKPFNPAMAGLANLQLGEASKREGKSPRAAPAQQTPTPKKDHQHCGDVHAFLRDPFDRPFIPATTVKGALRTALACAAVPADIDQQIDRATQPGGPRNLPPKRERAFQRVNERLFGRVIQDPLKALLIADGPPLEPARGFAVCQVQVWNEMRDGFKAKHHLSHHAECWMPEGGPVELPFRIDRDRLEKDKALARATAALLSSRQAFEDALRTRSQALLDAEIAFYHDRGQAARSPGSLLAQWQPPNDILALPLGYGTGWTSKTIGLLLQPRTLKLVRERFRMGRRGVDLFPKTRKWARSPQGIAPMGWCKVEILWA